uniref:Uncharacterized protein n=1 Tax=Marseillevirus LCMAC101 TaxID=2506602 RepID=A0A481YSE4_9VIRU|nr:MAG: hypothetical protein LCMAC101_05640 [Marseillevirus LCMAC101]
MEEIKQTIREEIENADGERKRVIYQVREQIKSAPWSSKSSIYILFGGMLANSPSLIDKFDDIANKLDGLTEDEHVQLWQFMLEQTENLKSSVQE